MSETSVQVGQPPVLLTAKPRRRRWVSILLGLILLLSGGIIGSGVTALIIVRGVQHRLHHPEEFPMKATARLRRSLQLSDPQAAAVETILRKRQAAIQDIRRGFQPKLEAEIEGLQKEIAAVLDPAQATKWNTWLDEKRQTWLPSVPPPK